VSRPYATQSHNALMSPRKAEADAVSTAVGWKAPPTAAPGWVDPNIPIYGHIRTLYYLPLLPPDGSTLISTPSAPVPSHNGPGYQRGQSCFIIRQYGTVACMPSPPVACRASPARVASSCSLDRSDAFLASTPPSNRPRHTTGGVRPRAAWRGGSLPARHQQHTPVECCGRIGHRPKS
jgi:hypothetical protein